MPRIEKKYRIEQGEFGSYRITQFGRCSGEQITIKEIEEKCTRIFTLVQIPNAKGVVLKSLDGTEPTIIDVEPTTMGGRKYRCVKIYGRPGIVPGRLFRFPVGDAESRSAFFAVNFYPVQPFSAGLISI